MIYLEGEQHRALRTEAAREGISMAELLRRLVRRYLEDRKGAPKVPRAAYVKLVNLGASGKSDVSERHDEYFARAIRRGRSR
ncbi:MAG: ribbon-helix-helix protein, CopG family [Armatimonadota bacterium]